MPRPTLPPRRWGQPVTVTGTPPTAPSTTPTARPGWQLWDRPDLQDRQVGLVPQELLAPLAPLVVLAPTDPPAPQDRLGRQEQQALLVPQGRQGHQEGQGLPAPQAQPARPMWTWLAPPRPRRHP